MRKLKDIEFALKCIYSYRDFLISHERINRNIFKSFRLDQIAGFIYGINYCLGSFNTFKNSFELIKQFPDEIHSCYHNHLNKIMETKHD